MVICDNCGAVMSEDDLSEHRYWLSDYMGGTYESCCECSHCGGDVSEAERCSLCGEYFRKDDLWSGICEDCLKSEMTVANAIDCGNEESAKEDVAINGFLASVFSAEEINAILLKAFEERVDASDANKNAAIDKAEEFIANDLSWFADWLEARDNK